MCHGEFSDHCLSGLADPYWGYFADLFLVIVDSMFCFTGFAFFFASSAFYKFVSVFSMNFGDFLCSGFEYSIIVLPIIFFFNFEN